MLWGLAVVTSINPPELVSSMVRVLPLCISLFEYNTILFKVCVIIGDTIVFVLYFIALNSKQ